MRNRNGLPKHCSHETDRHGRGRIRFRKGNVSRYIKNGAPWSPAFMAEYGDALADVERGTAEIGADKTVAGTLGALIKTYLDPKSSSPFKTGAPETRRTRRNILERLAAAHGDKPLYRVDHSGERVMLLKRERMQKIVNEKASTPFAQRNFLNTARAMFRWAVKEGRIPDDPTRGVTPL
jgi:hypothetical protein